MSYLRSFAPWIAFAVIPGSDWKWGALVALVISAAGLISHTAHGMPFDAQIIEAGSAAYFAALTVLAFADPNTSLHAYVPAMGSGALGLIAGISLLAGRPFTLGIAKQSVPQPVWSSPQFMRVNVIITSVWTACFVVGCIGLALLAHSSVLAKVVFQVGAFVVPMVFTVRYAAHIHAKARADAAAPRHAAMPRM